jgi:hypothetical protein
VKRRTVKTLVTVTNSNTIPVTLRLEPWGDEHAIPPVSSIQVRYSGPPGGELEIEHGPGEVVLWGAMREIVEGSVRGRRSLES